MTEQQDIEDSISLLTADQLFQLLAELLEELTEVEELEQQYIS